MAQFIDPFVGNDAGSKINNRELSRAIRQAIAAEHEATHLYEAIADATDNNDAKKLLQDIADEEKVHVHELQVLLESIDKGESKSKEEGSKEANELIGNVTEDSHLTINGNKYLLESGEYIKVLVESALHRRYLKVSGDNGDKYFASSSANDNYILHFIARLFKSKKFDNGDCKVSVVDKIPDGNKHMSLETFLKELIPIPERRDK